jgi:PAS domain S-box-containing protein
MRQTPDLREARLRASEERLRLAEAASGIGTFEVDLATGAWEWTPQAAALFGTTPQSANSAAAAWTRVVFPDDLPKLHAAIESARETGTYEVEFRIKHADGSLHWLAGKGAIVQNPADPARRLHGAFYAVTDRKVLEARLLALNETLSGRVGELREEARALDVLHRTGVAVAAELDFGRLVKTVTDAGVELSGAEFGALFYNVVDENGDISTLYALSGLPGEAFADLPVPDFEPTFRGLAALRSQDILSDPGHGPKPPFLGLPMGHRQARSYLAVPVVSRSGEALGGLFFGHSQPGIFTERAERLVTGVAAQAAVAIDNARLYQAVQHELAARKSAEEELQKLNQELEDRAARRAFQLAASTTKLAETEQRLGLLVDAVTDYAIFMLDAGGYVVNWNAGAERIKGYTREEIIGKHFSGFYTEQDRQFGIPQQAILTAARTGKYEAEGWRVRKDGSVFWANAVLNAIRDSDGGLLGFAKVTRDLTERRSIEKRLRHAQKMEAVGQLTGGIAHDFNNLLTVITGNIDAVQHRLPAGDADGLRRLTSAALYGAERGALLVHRLLAFSRRQPLEPKTIFVDNLITGMSELFRRTLGEGIEVVTIAADEDLAIFADISELESALLNLAINARDAMPDGGKLTIEAVNMFLDAGFTASAEISPGWYVGITVTDTGVGMSPDIAAKAFDPFFTTKGPGQGTGLGLSQVYGFIKQSGGHIRISSEVGAGTSINLYLPRHAASAVASEMRPIAVPAPRAKGETILVVEDDADVRHFTVDMVREMGYRVIDAADGSAGLRLIDAHREIRLVFADVGLPGGMNGRQFAEEARRRRTDLKVLFTSGYGRSGMASNGALDPGVELLAKPFTYATLAAKFRRLLDSP